MIKFDWKISPLLMKIPAWPLIILYFRLHTSKLANNLSYCIISTHVWCIILTSAVPLLSSTSVYRWLPWWHVSCVLYHTRLSCVLSSPCTAGWRGDSWWSGGGTMTCGGCTASSLASTTPCIAGNTSRRSRRPNSSVSSTVFFYMYSRILWCSMYHQDIN